jgi:hypothetical protein
MPASLATESPAWRNQFAQPTTDTLLAEIDPERLKLVETLRDGLLALETAEETLGWHGIPWRWSLRYSIKKADRAYIVPAPDAPSLAMPIRAAEIDAINLRSLSRPVREGVVNAAYVDGVLWAEWELTAQTQVSDLLSFLAKLLAVAK